MKKNQKFHILQCFIVLSFLLGSSISEKTNPNTFCGKIKIQPPFLSSNPTGSFPLNHMILCKSQKLYFRTSIGLFPISKIDYTTKTLTISHFHSSSSHFVSPSLLSSGLPSPPNLINSLLLFHCSNNPTKPFSQKSPLNCTHLHNFEQQSLKTYCFIFEDLGMLNNSFHPNHFKCSHFRRVYRNSSDFGYKLGTAISFDIPDHVPNLCNQCQKADGHCGVGLKCICHVLDCSNFLSLSETLHQIICSFFTF